MTITCKQVWGRWAESRSLPIKHEWTRRTVVHRNHEVQKGAVHTLQIADGCVTMASPILSSALSLHSAAARCSSAVDTTTYYIQLQPLHSMILHHPTSFIIRHDRAAVRMRKWVSWLTGSNWHICVISHAHSHHFIIIVYYYARRQQNHTDKTPKTQNCTTVYK